MRIIFFSWATTVFALAQSHPSWWTLASPDATAIVGIHWDNLKQSVFAEPVAAELSSTGSLGFPDLPCIKDATQVLISSPALLAIATGPFDAKTVSREAVAAHMKPAVYNNAVLWISPAKATLSVALLSDQLMLIGLRKTLEAAIDRSKETHDAQESDRRYSPLLARAARYQSKDLWVVASQLPDPLASLFVPIETETKGFDGSVSVRDGLHLEATIDAGSEDAAATVGEFLRSSISTLPAIARDLKVTVDAQHVLLTLEVTQQHFVSGLRPTFAPAATPTPTAAPTPIPLPAPVTPTPQVIRIFGLDEGPREIPLPPPRQQ